MLVIDLVKNPEGETLAITLSSRGNVDCWKTANNGQQLHEDRLRYFFKRKSDMKKIRESKEKRMLIDRLNQSILRQNISDMAEAMEYAEERLFTAAQDLGYHAHGDRWFEELGDSGVPGSIAKAARKLHTGLAAYSSLLGICGESGLGAYTLELERVSDRWEAIKSRQQKG